MSNLMMKLISEILFILSKIRLRMPNTLSRQKFKRKRSNIKKYSLMKKMTKKLRRNLLKNKLRRKEKNNPTKKSSILKEKTKRKADNNKRV